MFKPEIRGSTTAIILENKEQYKFLCAWAGGTLMNPNYFIHYPATADLEDDKVWVSSISPTDPNGVHSHSFTLIPFGQALLPALKKERK